jgi:hypothetical protein
MTTMVRKQVYIRPDQEKRLKRAAAEEGVTEAELIRRGIDGVLNGDSGSVDALPTDPDQRRRTHEEARDDFLKLLADLAKREPTGEAPFKWDRNEVYEERLGRFLR